ncbi:MAG: class I SAM-dependent methyltransferase [Phycisphaerales bacterium]|nr:class I SAM-dependent methyltransferase [Phycisphaerales bacterium]
MTTRYDIIGRQYDATRRADPYIASRLLSLLAPTEVGRYADVACGSGNYTIALAGAGLSMTGIDQSKRMLDVARAKSFDVEWCRANAEALPMPDGAFDGAVCTLAIHHFRNLDIAFAEIRRILHRGRLVLLTASRRQMRNYWLNAYFPDAMMRSIEQMPDLPRVEQAMRNAGFADVRTEGYSVREDLQDCFLYSGKLHPAMYLDPQVRAGISTFSLLADPEEVESGCKRLALDIASGEFVTVSNRFTAEVDDYTFVIADTGTSG